MARKNLPVGNDSFREVRGSGYYVDKTAFIARLIDEDKHNFLSRPRRFGKSLLVDTLQELFGREEELFRGLYIHDKWDWGVKYPVVRLDFTGANFTQLGQLNLVVMEQLAAIERSENLTTEYETTWGRFADLIKKLFEEKGQRVVILVDEYDKPITDALDRPGMEDVAQANLDYLRGLYGNIKRCNKYIRFSFLTGVSKFAKAGIFSGLNNLRDITLSPGYSSICGYTEADLDNVFAQELKEFDREKIKRWYNGYNWRGEENVYNPFSILRLLREREFFSWWYDTGTPTFLIDALKKRGGIGTLGLERMSANNELLSSLDIGKMNVPALLFQTGYLTIVGEEKDEGEEDSTFYRLGYPNLEVRQSLHWSLLDDLTEGVSPSKLSSSLRKALVSGDFDALKVGLNALLAGIPNDVYRNTPLAEYEGHYASVVQIGLAGTDLTVHAEDTTNLGRIDLTVDAGTRIYVFEFKVLGENVQPGDAIQQIRDRGYADKYLGRGVPVYRVGVEFDPAKRNIQHFDFEEA